MASSSQSILGIDTATAAAAVAVSRGTELLDERRSGPGEGGRPEHARVLLAEVEAAVQSAGGWPEIGLIGIATARALAQARDLPLAPVSSLAALARGIDAGPGRGRLAAIDARRGELFAGLYDDGHAPVWEPFVAAPDAITERVAQLPRPALAAGDGSLRFREQLEAAGVEVLPAADPAHLMAARHVSALATEVEPVRPEHVKPIYLRRPDAEVWRERRERDP